MPQRPREHQLETESRLAFHTVLPSAWVLRNLTDDYGIDAEVELFDANGFATGEKFLVQLKATDETDETRALKVFLPRETGRYYDSLRLPVLIVRYVASRKQLYTRWFHAFDPVPKTKSLVLCFAPGDAWTPEAPSMLAACVAAYRQLREPVLLGDVTFLLDFPPVIHGVPRYELTSSLQESAEEIRRIHFRAARAGEYAPNRIRVTNDVIEIVLAERKGFVLATGAGYQAEEERGSLHQDILTGVGLALATFGHHTAASWILSRHAIHSNLLTIRSIAMQVGPALAEAHHFASLIEIADELLRREQIDEAAVYLMTFFTWHTRLSPAERQLAVEFVARMAARLLDRGDIDNAAMAHHNCAVLFRNSGAFREAIREYRRAAAVDPEYLTRAYWWAELAGVLFVSGRFAMSAQLYERAYALEPSDLYGRNYADALLFRGSYGLAAQVLDKHLVNVTEEASEWVLKRIALQYIRDFTRREEQRRRPDEALDLFTGVSLDEDVPERLSRDALQLDALSGIAWFNLANGFYHQGRLEAALGAYLAAAVSTPADVEAWANVIGLAQRLNDHTLSGLVHSRWRGPKGSGSCASTRSTSTIPPLERTRQSECLSWCRASLLIGASTTGGTDRWDRSRRRTTTSDSRPFAPNSRRPKMMSPPLRSRRHLAARVSE